MALESTLATLGPLVAVLAPMIGAPLGLITFYLRAIRENVSQSHAALARRVDAIESTALELRRALGDIPRDYTTKEEWLRELLHNRRVLEQVTEATIRLQSTLDALFAHPTIPTPRPGESDQVSSYEFQSPLRKQRMESNQPSKSDQGRMAQSSDTLAVANSNSDVSASTQEQSPLRKQRTNPNRDRERAALHVSCPPNRESQHNNDPEATISCPALHTESVPYDSPGQRPGETSPT